MRPRCCPDKPTMASWHDFVQMLRRRAILDRTHRGARAKHAVYRRRHDRSRHTLPKYRSCSNPYLWAYQHPLVRAVLYRRSAARLGLCASPAATRNCGRARPLWANRPRADDIGDLFVWVTLGVIIGGRLGWVLLYGMLYCGIRRPCAPAAAACRRRISPIR